MGEKKAKSPPLWTIQINASPEVEIPAQDQSKKMGRPSSLTFVTEKGIDLTQLQHDEFESMLAPLNERQKEILELAVSGIPVSELSSHYKTETQNIYWTLKRALFRIDHPFDKAAPRQLPKQQVIFAGINFSEMEFEKRKVLYKAAKLTDDQAERFELRYGLKDGRNHSLKEIREATDMTSDSHVSQSIKRAKLKLNKLNLNTIQSDFKSTKSRPLKRPLDSYSFEGKPLLFLTTKERNQAYKKSQFSKQERRLFEYIVKNPQASFKQIENNTGVSKKMINLYLDKIAEKLGIRTRG